MKGSRMVLLHVYVQQKSIKYIYNYVHIVTHWMPNIKTSFFELLFLQMQSPFCLEDMCLCHMCTAALREAAFEPWSAKKTPNGSNWKEGWPLTATTLIAVRIRQFSWDVRVTVRLPNQSQTVQEEGSDKQDEASARPAGSSKHSNPVD